MSYTKTNWVDEVLAGAERFDIKENGGAAFKSTMQIALATSVSVAGTPVGAANLNHLEQGVSDATLPIHRQGGSSTDWAVGGTSNYTPAAGVWGIQGGASVTGTASAGETTITFPVAFTYIPIVIATVLTNLYDFPVITAITATTFTIKFVNVVDGLSKTGVPFNWIANGPF